ncbi:MAG TPA: PP2C family serine/threonine-protein phosphatase [Caulobacteraceae bacterium]
MRLRSAGLTHPGLVRRANEDALLMREADGLWLVADGMGGLEDGAWAAQVVAERVARLATGQSSAADAAAVGAALQGANGEINMAARRRRVSIGSTAACLLLGDGAYACVWAGDSRAYRLRGGELQQLTRDHSHVQELVEQGRLAAADARRHPARNVVTRAVGIDPVLSCETVTGNVQGGDRFLVCSDGLTEVVEDAEIAADLEAEPEAACELLLALALERGAPDNVTLAVIAVSGGPFSSMDDPAAGV